MEFDPALSFSDNLARFRAEAEGIDTECARILFDNLAVLAALDGLPEGPAA